MQGSHTTQVNLDGVDVKWVVAQLTEYVTETRPVNDSGPGFISLSMSPACGYDRAVHLTEVVKPILNRLYPEYASENAPRSTDGFSQVREASRRLLARIATQAEIAEKLGGDESPRLNASAMHPLI